MFSNTEWAYGIAIYTGQETKIQMNNRNAPSKMSRIEEYLNKAIVFIFIAQCLLVTAAVVSFFALNCERSDIYYLYPSGDKEGIMTKLLIVLAKCDRLICALSLEWYQTYSPTRQEL
jgi:magnesium-transporting ATPase (P-type)